MHDCAEEMNKAGLILGLAAHQAGSTCRALTTASDNKYMDPEIGAKIAKFTDALNDVLRPAMNEVGKLGNEVGEAVMKWHDSLGLDCDDEETTGDRKPEDAIASAERLLQSLNNNNEGDEQKAA